MDYRIVVDAGHGGSDPGAVSGNLKESDLNLEAALYMYDRFKELGVPVTITRDSDRTLTRNERLNTMKSFGTDSNVIILSNHINAGGGEGAEIVYPLRSSDVLPKAILEAIGDEGQIMRKVYQRVLPEDTSKDYYYIMRDTPNTTSLLIEYGFIDNPNDVIKLQNNLTDYVEAVVKAVSNYIGIEYKEPGFNDLTNNTYTVVAGDTLYSIASNFGVSVVDLIYLNNLDSTILNVGQVLEIPSVVSNYATYIVKKGDTLYSIANSYGTTVNKIMSLNNLNSSLLLIGQELLIPTDNSITETNYPVYTVVSGDTLYSISKRYNVSVDSIKALNNLKSNLLMVGQRLQIPLDEVTSSNFVYTVKRGDTLYSISNSYNTTVDKIMSLNNLNSTLLLIGQELLIPKK